MEKKGLTCGFITVATGKYYCYLAENLVRSYRVFSDNKYPFGVITDKKSEPTLRKSGLFDDIVIMDNPSYNYLDKIFVYQNTPYDNTVFIDADSDITNDITYLVDDFLELNSDVSCIGEFRNIPEWTPNHFSKKTIDKYNLNKYIAFNGGVYFFKKSDNAEKCMEFIINELEPNYDDYGLNRLFKKKTDEALMGLGMLLCGMKPLKSEKDIMKLVQNTKNVKWNMKEKKCSFVWYGMTVGPTILHWMTSFTKCIKYINMNAKVEGKYNKSCFIITFFKILSRDIKFFFSVKFVAFLKRICAHFTIEHFKYRLSQIKKVFVRK